MKFNLGEQECYLKGRGGNSVKAASIEQMAKLLSHKGDVTSFQLCNVILHSERPNRPQEATVFSAEMRDQLNESKALKGVLSEYKGIFQELRGFAFKSGQITKYHSRKKVLR